MSPSAGKGAPDDDRARRRAPPADAQPGRRDRGRGVRRDRPRSCTSASAARRSARRCWSTRSAATPTGYDVRVPVQHRRRGVRRGGRAASIRRRRWSSSRRKTFTTTETLTNLDAALDWLREAGVDDPYGRSSRSPPHPEQAVDVGHRRDPHPAVRRRRRRALFAVVVGRLVRSRWRSAGTRSRSCSKARRRWTAISAAPTAPPMSPLLAAFADLLYVAASRRARRRAVFAYDERLRLLPDYLQQLEMESNGKSVTADGEPRRPADGAGHLGRGRTDAQHAVFQLLHQGTRPRPGRVRRGDRERGQPRPATIISMLLLNCLRAGRGADGRAGERRSAARLSRQPAVDDDPARPARRRGRWAR